MFQRVKKILIVTKPDDKRASSLGIEMTAFLADFEVETRTCEHLPDACDLVERFAGVCDLILVLGGDGTFIGIARRMLSLNAPLMGVNLGRVGFLTQMHKDLWRPWLKQVVEEGVEVSNRLALEYKVLRDGKSVHNGVAINDLVIGRGLLARLVRLGVSYNGLHISNFRSDGLIVSTPTGSSAYGASAGGPLIYPDLFAYTVTPVCPFLNSFKPMVFPSDGECLVCVEEQEGEVSLTEDGQSTFDLKHGDEIVIRQSPSDLRVVNLGLDAYFEKLKKHGFLTEK